MPSRLSFPGLPPLPQSLSGVEVSVTNSGYAQQQNDRSENDGRTINLDNHLAILKREMVGILSNMHIIFSCICFCIASTLIFYNFSLACGNWIYLYYHNYGH